MTRRLILFSVLVATISAAEDGGSSPSPDAGLTQRRPTDLLGCSPIGGIVGGGFRRPRQGPDDPVSFREGMTRPKRIEGSDPELTAEARDAGIKGLMLVNCIIETEGTATDCVVIKAPPGLEQAGLAALRTWKFEPATLSGKPVRVEYVIPVRFSDPSKQPDPAAP